MSNPTQSNLSRSFSAAPAAGATARGREVVLLLSLMIAVAAITFAVHRPVLDAKAISFDDNETFVQNPYVQKPSWSTVKRFFSEVTDSSVVRGYYRPLTLASLMLDWKWGASTSNFRPFHRTSLILHIGSTLLIVLLCYQIFGQPVVAALVGLLFGLHPLTVEPIAWVMERKTVLAAFFAFACLCSFVRYAHCGRWRWFGLALVLYLLSLLSKPTGTPLPIMMLLIDYWPLKRFGRRAVLEKIPFFLLAAAFAVLTYACENRVGPLQWPIAEFPGKVCWLVFFYLGKVTMPVHLTSVYMLPDPLKLANHAVLACVVGTIALVAALVLSRRWTPAFWVGTAIFFVGLAPTMGLVHYSWVAVSDKYVYLPAVGLILVVAWILTSIWGTGPIGFLAVVRRVFVIALAIVAASALAVGTRLYLPEWQTTERLTAYMFKLAPNSDVANYEMGSLLQQKAMSDPRTIDQGKLDEAFTYFQKASQLDSKFAAPFYGMGWVFAVRGKLDEAIEQYNLAVQQNKNYLKPYVGLFQAYEAKNLPDKAIEIARRVIELRPNLPLGYQMLGAVLIHGRQAADAVAELTEAVRIIPDDAELLTDLANVLVQAGKLPEAVDRYDQALRIRPDSAIGHYRIANLLGAAGRRADAVQHYAEALRLSSNRPAVMNALAWTLATNNLKPPPGTPSAVELAEKACEISQRQEPGYLDTLAAAYARAGRFREAEQVADEAIKLLTPMDRYDAIRAIDARRHLYRSEQPYDEPPPRNATAPTPAASEPAR